MLALDLDTSCTMVVGLLVSLSYQGWGFIDLGVSI